MLLKRGDRIKPDEFAFPLERIFDEIKKIVVLVAAGAAAAAAATSHFGSTFAFTRS